MVLVLPTGAGKTRCAVEFLRHEPGRAIFVAHRDDLIEDTCARLGGDCGRIQAGVAPSSHRIQVASIQTLAARGLTPDADLLILDECHRSVSPRLWQPVLQRYPTARVLGLTATPVRGDGVGLSHAFEHLIRGPTIAELTALGHLVPCDVRTYRRSAALALPLDAAVRRYGAGRATVVFAASIAESQALGCAHVDGATPRLERRRILDDFREGRIDVLANSSLLTEGWDAPRCEVIVLGRGCTHVGSYLQIVGRGLRPSPGKTACLFVDLCGVADEFGLPDEEREWTLNGCAVKRPSERIPLRSCPECLACFKWQDTCPRCGIVIPGRPPRKVKERPPLDSITPWSTKLTWLRELQRSHPGWQAIAYALRFKARYGHMPHRGVWNHSVGR